LTLPEPSDEIWQRAEIESPCIRICVIQPQSRLCVGCHRTIDEIAQWSRMTPATRSSVMAELPGRAGQLTQRRGGRAGRLSAS